MGYALFANRKLYYTNLINTLQQKLDNIAQQKTNLASFSATISDGLITVYELASDPSNLGNCQQYLGSYDEFINKADSEGGCATSINEIMSKAVETNQDPAYLQALAEQINQQTAQKYAQQYSKQLEQTENQLDLQQKKIETQLSVAQQQLQAVEQAESYGIQQATPKYSGIG